MRLIHLTDPHLSSPDFPLRGRSHYGKRYLGLASWRRRRRFKHRREWLDELVTSAKAQQPDLFVVTGDLVHIGLPEEIEQAGDWLRSLGDPDQVVLVPGNHDNYAADSWSAISECWGAYLGDVRAGGYPFTRKYQELELLGVSTALPTRPGSACGLVGEQQLAALAKRLETPRTGPRFLAIHHPPFPGMISFRKRLRDADCLEAITTVENTHVILHGHDLTDREALHRGVRVFGTSSASYQRGSFRRFDIAPVDHGWRVEMNLFRRQDAGEYVSAQKQCWQV